MPTQLVSKAFSLCKLAITSVLHLQDPELEVEFEYVSAPREYAQPLDLKPEPAIEEPAAPSQAEDAPPSATPGLGAAPGFVSAGTTGSLDSDLEMEDRGGAGLGSTSGLGSLAGLGSSAGLGATAGGECLSAFSACLALTSAAASTHSSG